MSNTPMEDLLKIETDEVEESPDNPTPASTGPATPTSEVKEVAGATTPAAPSPTEANPQGDGEEDGKRRMTALPKWAHERLRANDTKAEAAERARLEAVEEARAARARAAELEAYIQNNGHAPPQQQQDEYDPKQAVRDAIWETRRDLGWDRAVEKYGESMPSEATHWAMDRVAANPAFGQQLYAATDPVAFSIREFKKAQAADELDKYGWDLDALAKARAAQVAAANPAPAQTMPAAVVTKGAPPTPASPLPSDFASAPNGGGRTAPVFAGPTPLGQLLNTKRG